MTTTATSGVGSTSAPAFPCSICDSTFGNPRELGNHILTSHCDEAAPSAGGESWSTVSGVEGATPIPEALMAIQSPTAVQSEAPSTPKVIALPRAPTQEELNQKFLMQKISDTTTKYICLLCSKVYTSRYNIRMHMNMHSGKNVHTCSHCGRYFAHKHVFESHVRTHTGERPFKCQKCGKGFGDRSNCTSHQKKCKGNAGSKVKVISTSKLNNNLAKEKEEIKDDDGLPKIVSVKSLKNGQNREEETVMDDSEDKVIIPNPLSDLDVDDIIDDSIYDEDLEEMEEIQIEPDIIDYGDDDDEEEEEEEQVDEEEINGNPDIVLPQSPVPINSLTSASFSCSFCDAGFETQAELIAHLSHHITLPKDQKLPEPPSNKKQSFRCLKCGKAFDQAEHLKAHVQVHNEVGEYQCRTCGINFDTFREFETHSATHAKDALFKCKFCNLGFSTDSFKLDHQRDCSMNLSAGKSPASSKMTTRGKSRKVSSTMDMTSSPDTASKLKYPSDDNYVPDSNSNNVINKEEIEPPPSTAEVKQGYCFRTLNNGQQRIVCVTCGKHYTTMYNMRQHRNIHTRKNLYKCRYCGKEFTHKHVWETHERIHTGERPFKCPHCGKDFADRSNYNSHRKLCASSVKR